MLFGGLPMLPCVGNIKKLLKKANIKGWPIAHWLRSTVVLIQIGDKNTKEKFNKNTWVGNEKIIRKNRQNIH